MEKKEGCHTDFLDGLWRGAVIYLVLLFAMKLLGKRQVGELQISELVTTLIISEIATTPISQPDTNPLLPLAALASILLLEFLISILLLKLPLMRTLIESKPNKLIVRGKPDLDEMRRARVTYDEVLSELRLLGVNEPEQVYSATLESNGRLSYELKSAYRPLCPDDVGMRVPEDGACHTVILMGKPDDGELRQVGRDRRWLDAILKTEGKRVEEILLFTVTDGGEIFFLPFDKKRSAS